MSIDELIRTRRTHKAYAPEPVDRATLEELFELARWAPNHNLTNPWRFRVLGPRALGRAQAGRRARGRGASSTARRRSSPPRVLQPATTGRRRGGLRRRRRARRFIVLLGAHARGLAGYWRTPDGAAHAGGPRRVSGSPDGERVLGLIHLGRTGARSKARARARRRSTRSGPTSRDARRAPTPSRRSRPSRSTCS